MDPRSAHTSFMNSTGFGQMAPMAESENAPPPKITSARDTFPDSAPLKQMYRDEEPRATGPVAGTVRSPPYSSEMETPLHGLVPGHLPLRDSMLTSPPGMPYPSSDRIGKLPFTYQQQRQQQPDLRAVGVGPITNRNSPGMVPISSANQGRYFNVRGLTGLAEQATASYPAISYVFLFLIIIGLLFFFKLLLARNNVPAIMVIGFLCAMSGTMLYINNKKSESLVSEVRDTNKGRQMYKPLMRHQADHNPYPRQRDFPDTTLDRMNRLNVDMNNVEGPRADFGYKRGPTPGNQRRLQEGELMRSAELYNMDQREFNEYMARLDGEAPDQFYQAHAYMPFSPHWDHKQDIGDTDTVHGISTQPGQSLRKSKYIDPRIQQAGAKTSHLKDPPPGSDQPIEKVHPWLQKSLETAENAFSTDAYIAQAISNRENGHGEKVSKQQIEDLVLARERENQQTQAELGYKTTSDMANMPLPAALQPIATSQAGFDELHAKKQDEMARFAAANDIARQPPQHPKDNAAPPPALLYGGDEAQSGESNESTGFGGAFAIKNQPDESAVTAALQNSKRD